MSANESWAGAQDFLDVDFVDEHTGYALLNGPVGEPTLLETVREDLPDDETSDEVWTGAWQVVNRSHSFSGSPDSPSRAVEFFSPASGSDPIAFAYGDSEEVTDVIWKSIDGGRTWSVVRRPRRPAEPGGAPDEQAWEAYDFAFTTTDGQGVVAVGEGAREFPLPPDSYVHRVRRSTDGGETWTQHEDSRGLDLNAVDFVPATQAQDAMGVAVGKRDPKVGDHGPEILISDDGGASWKRVESEAIESIDEPLRPPNERTIAWNDVAVASEPQDGGQTIAVAVGVNYTAGTGGQPTGGVLAYSDDEDLAEWTLLDPGTTGLPNLQSVALADTDPDESGGLVGYAVSGQAPIVLEMEPDDPTTWTPAASDPRAGAFGRALQSVAATPRGQTAVAVGGQLMLERTPIDESGAQAVADDEWWRCAPREGSLGSGNDDVDDTYDEQILPVLKDQEPENDDDPGVRTCDERSEDLTAPAPPEPFDPGPATTGCRLEGGSEQFPCHATWQPLTGVDSDGQPEHADMPPKVFLDEDLAGEGRRLVAVDSMPDGGRIYLFDPDRLEQRGVSGFGEGREPGAQLQDDDSGTHDAAEFARQSAFGATTGVIDLHDAPETFPHDANALGGVGSAGRDDTNRRAYDSANHVVYLGSEETSGGGRETVGTPPVIAAVSLTGDFAPTTAATIPPLVDEASPDRTNAILTNLTFDPRHGMLYALTETNPKNAIPASPNMASGVQVSLRAYKQVTDTSGRPTGELEFRWSLPLENHDCRSTYNYLANGMAFAVSNEGDVLSFVCPGYAAPHFGNPNFEPNRVMTVRLRLGPDGHPAGLDPDESGDVVVHAEPIAGTGISLGESNVTLSAKARDVLVWNQQTTGANLWDFEVGGWIGTVVRQKIAAVTALRLDADHSRRGRMYMSCVECVDHDSDDDDDDDTLQPAMLAVDTLNVPAQTPAGITEAVPLPSGAGFPAEFEQGHVLKAIPPHDSGALPRVAMSAGPHDDGGVSALHIFEDRISPALEQEVLDPDVNTHPEVPEDEANDVTRTARARGYGARLWWTGLGTATSPACSTYEEVGPGWVFGTNDACGKPTFNYDWLTGRSRRFAGVEHGRHVGSMPGLPAAGTRELRLGEVQASGVEAGELSQRADAEAVPFFYGGGPADEGDGNTGEDAHRRRGRDPHRFLDSELAQFCDSFLFLSDNEDFQEGFQEGCGQPHDGFQDGHEDFDGQFGPYEAAFAEGVDRAMREVDGQRTERGGCAPREDRNDDGEIDEEDNQGHFEQADDDDTDGVNEADCWEDFDRRDPRCDEDDEGNVDCSDRSSLQERAELTHASQCLEPAGRDERWTGSRTECELGLFGHTEASAGLEGFSLTPEETSEEMSAAAERISIGATGSQTRAFRDEDSGMIVGEVSAWASDLDLRIEGGSLEIGEVRQTARAWAHGRPGTADSSREVTFHDVAISGPEGERFTCGRSEGGGAGVPPSSQDVDANGDGTPDALEDDDGDDNDTPEGFEDDDGDRVPNAAEQASQACDPHEVADVISTIFAGKVQATTSPRDTTPDIAGSDGGAQAMVRRDSVDVLSDQVINNIERQFELPALQLTIFNDGLRPNRMKIDLAAVYSETHYEIKQRRLEVPDPVPEPGTLEVELDDLDGAPLAGGEFVVHRDGDGDGEREPRDLMVGECRTGITGTCTVGDLDAGSYIVEQRLAPDGFRAAEQGVGVYVPAGATETMTFTNAPSSAAVEVLLVDPSGRPLAGGQFALVADAGQDGTVDPSDSVAASCVTGDAGTCSFDGVPLGVYVLHQAGAPQGFEAADDVAFALRSPGQVARIKIVNGTGVASAQVEIIEIIETVGTASGGDDDQGVLATLAQVPKVFADILLRDPIQALLFGLTAGLFGAPLYLAVRRRELSNVRQGR